MKMVLTFILILFSINSWGQNLSKDEKIIDSILLSKINQYRAENHLQRIVFYTKADSLSKSHNQYMIDSNTKNHLEIFGKDTIRPEKRIGAPGIENIISGGLCENISINRNIYETKSELQKSNKILNDFFASLVIDEWKNSSLHNKNMLDKNIQKGAVSIKFDFNKSKFVADFIAYY